MERKLLISSSTEKTTKLKGLEKLLKPASGESTASVASVGDETQSLSAFAIVDGAKLLENDVDEQEVLSNALEQKIPIVMENANKDITSALTGTGVDHEVVVLKPEGNSVTLSLVESSIPSQADAASTESENEPIKKSVPGPKGSPGEVAEFDEEFVVKEAPLEERVSDALLAFGADPLTITGNEEIQLWRSSDKLTLPRHYHEITDRQSGKKQMFSIMVDVSYDLYAANNPAFKYLVVKLIGSGFSAGNMAYDVDWARCYIQDKMTVSLSPSNKYKGMVIEQTHPQNQNGDGSWTVSSGFEVGAGLKISKEPGLDLSVSYNRTTSATQHLKEFDVINKSDQLNAFITYKLASMEGAPLNDENMDGEVDKSNRLKYRLRNVPILAKALLTPQCEVIWRFPADFDQKVEMNLNLSQYIRSLYHGIDDNYHSDRVATNRLNYTFEVDLSKVQVPPKPESSIPKFAARILVEYKPEKGEVFKLRSLGDGTFEILESSTVPIPPQQKYEPPILAYHKVQRGDMLSAISLRYYGSAVRDKWYPIYEANKDIMTGGYNDLRPGMVLKIPEEQLG